MAIRFRAAVLFIVLMAVVSLGACKSRNRTRVQTDEEPPRMAAVLSMADPRANAQLVNGFYPVEQNAWRWTASKFSVILRTPRSADQKGATLKLKLTVPDSVIQQVKSTGVSATLNGVDLAPESYTQSGEYIYTRDVPARAFAGDSVKIDFALQKFIPPGPVDARELGIVVSMVGLEGK